MRAGRDAPSGPAELVKKMQAGGWAQLETVLKMGAARYEKGFALPYLFAKFPEDLEAFEHVVTIRAGAVLRAEGRAGAAVVCRWITIFCALRTDGPWEAGSGRSGWTA